MAVKILAIFRIMTSYSVITQKTALWRDLRPFGYMMALLCIFSGGSDTLENVVKMSASRILFEWYLFFGYPCLR